MKITDTIKYVGVNDQYSELWVRWYRVRGGVGDNAEVILK